MKQARIVAVAAALAVLFAGVVLAGGSETPQEKTDAKSAAAPATSNASKAEAASAKQSPALMAILEKGAKVPEEERQRTAAAMHTTEVQINDKADVDGPQSLADRLAGEFGVTSESVLAVRDQTKASWGNLSIAYTLAAIGESGAKPADLLALHADGTGWGQIAAGVGLPLGQAVKAVQEESRVAMGLEKADGHVLKRLEKELSAGTSSSASAKESHANGKKDGSEAKSASSGGEKAPH